jgi:DNA repair protein RecO (recombination protein O)
MQGVILKKSVFSEGNEIVVIYTEELGKVRAVARAVKSSKSKLAFALQSLFLSDIDLSPSRSKSNLYTITGDKSIEAFQGIRADLKKAYAGFYAAELVMKSTPEEEPNPGIFNLLVGYLKHLDQEHAATNSEELSYPCNDVFTLKVLGESGYAIRLDNCVSCSAALKDQDVEFSSRRGGFLCPLCAEKTTDTSFDALGTRKFLSENMDKSFDELDKVKISLADQTVLHNLAQGYARYILERNLNAAKYL